MKYFTTLLLLGLLTYLQPCQSAFNKCTSQSAISSSKIVNTLNGAIKGECYSIPVSFSNDSTINYEVFSWLSIPYAEPPIGNNRFMSPKPVNNWLGTKNTVEWPKSCFQSISTSTETEMSEDCLYLNVFAPASTYLKKDQMKTPILLYIHGGGFIQGTSADDLWEPSTLVASRDIIVVTINYRLTVFGFMHMAGSDATGNAGFLDQNLAMKWVYENANKFGGDKNRITIAGESAGAFSVGYHLFYPSSWEFFRNGIMESGGPIGSNNAYKLMSSSSVTASAKLLFNEIGCGNSASNNEALKCAQSIDAKTVMDKVTSLGFKVTFRLVQENSTFSQPIDDLVQTGSFKKCSLITGFNSDEYGFFLATQMPLSIAKSLTYAQLKQNLNYLWLPERPSPELITTILDEYQVASSSENKATFIDYLIQIQSDQGFVCQSLAMADAYAGSGSRVYMYKYQYLISSSPYDRVYGQAVHTAELPVVFGEAISNKIEPLISNNNPYSRLNHNYSLDTKRFTEQLNDYWTNFVKYDDPNHSDQNPEWTPYMGRASLDGMTAAEKMKNANFLLFTNEAIRMSSNLLEHRCQFWNFTRDGVASGVGLSLKAGTSVIWLMNSIG